MTGGGGLVAAAPVTIDCGDMWKWKPYVEFQYCGRLGEFNGMSSHSHVSHCMVLPLCEFTVTIPEPHAIGAVSGNGIIKINLLLHAFPVVTAKERNVISIAFRHRSVHDGHSNVVEVLQVNGLDGTC